jgi:hypothetical protein
MTGGILLIFLSVSNHFRDKCFFRVFELSHFQKVSELLKMSLYKWTVESKIQYGRTVFRAVPVGT